MSSNKKTSEQQDNEILEEENSEKLEENDNEEECPAETSVEEEGQNLEEIIAENHKLKEDFLRAYAEAENVKKRCQQEMEKSIKFALADFSKSLLPVADNLQRAIDAAGQQDSESENSLKKGIELTQNELMRVFDKFGIHKMDIIGKVFDPNYHRVVQEVEDKTKPAGTIVAEIQTGYMIHDRILREAMVVVTK